MTSGPEAYSWINDTYLCEAGCVTVVPAADSAAVLTAFGVDVSSGRPGSLNDLGMGAGAGGPIYSVTLGEAMILFENNGFQGARPEVLGPASSASRAGVASSFFWNINALTSFSGARNGAVLFGVELIGPEDEDDQELADVPAQLRALVVEGGSEDGDMLGSGLALIAAHTATPFSASVVSGGVIYEAAPVPEDLRDYRLGRHDVSGLRDAPALVGALSQQGQRLFAEWAAAASVREADVGGEAAVAEVLAQFGRGSRPSAPSSLDQLAQATAKRHNDFSELVDQREWGGLRSIPAGRCYIATVPSIFGQSRGMSVLEGAYLGQRDRAVEAVRYACHEDPLSAALGSLDAASSTFERGRTARGWIFESDPDGGRYRVGTAPNPRHTAFVEAVTALLADLATTEDGYRACLRASSALPRPLRAAERRRAIHEDAVADAEGKFATYQMAAATDLDEEDDDEDEAEFVNGWRPPADPPVGGLYGYSLGEIEYLEIEVDIDVELRPEGWPKAWPRPDDDSNGGSTERSE
ncbi:DUF6461 domain-containing protein [Nocardioides sp. GXZ039]|uniref:DUF6461 domain-containing protein n=1 Tax=Nocardioides sp. GXZ039 TaxID=3136018 RepID=UPI0030F4A256